MNCCVIGIGQFGLAAAVGLLENNNHVCVVDKDISIISNIQDKFSYAICMDVVDEQSLQSIGIDTYDVVIIAMGQSFEELVIIAGILKKKFSIPMIICRANNDQQKIILQMIGIDFIILPEKESALNLVDKISVGYGYFHRIADNYSITYLRCKKNWIGKTKEEIEKKHPEIVFLGIKVQSEIEMLENTYFFSGTELLVLSGLNSYLIEI
jgi:trk system potassium uptake protein TrkA